MSISCVNYVYGSDTSTHQQIKANSAKTPAAQYKISSDSMWEPWTLSCDTNSFRSRANCEILKLILNHTSCDLFFLQNSKCTTVEWRQLTFLPRPYGVHLNKFLLRADRFLVFQMYLGDIVTFKTLKPISFHSSILEHISSSLVRYPEVYFDQRWSERNENPPWKCLRQARHHVCHFVNVYCGLVPPLPPHIWTSNNCTTLWKNRT